MPEILEDTLTRLSAFVSENYSDIETAPGSVISELLLKLAAAIQNEQYNTIDTLNQGANINAVLASTTDTYSSVIDGIASNYNTTRNQGQLVRGKIKVTVAEDNTYDLLEDTTFEQPALGLLYKLTREIRVSPEPDTQLQEIKIYQGNDGLFHFILDVEAIEVGPEYQVSSGTSFTLSTDYYIRDFVKAEAYGNFSSGQALETDKQLISRIKENLGSSKLESSAGITNKFKSTFSGFQYLSICGANDAEMTRDKQNCFGVATFGKADVYVRSSMGPEIKQIVKRAKKIADGTWELLLDNVDIPGFYTIQSITPDSSNVSLGGTLKIISTDFDIQFYQGQRKNEISRIIDARFTKYQSARVIFNYADSPAISINEYANFNVHAYYQPNILDMQDVLLDDDGRLACADYLIKAVIPCMVSLNINLTRKRVADTYDSLNIQQLKKDIFYYVNTIPFGGELHASNIIDICHNYDIKRVDLPISMEGLILCPDNTTITISDTDVLAIPNNLQKGVTPKTAAYFIDYYRIDATSVNPVDNIGITIT